MTREATDVCFRELFKESNKSRFDSYRVRNSVFIIIPILPFGIVSCTFSLTTFLEIAVNRVLCVCGDPVADSYMYSSDV